MLLAFGHIYFATSGLTCMLVGFTLVGIASEAAAIPAPMSESFVVESYETGLEVHGTTFLDCGNMPKIFLSIKLVSRKMLTARL